MKALQGHGGFVFSRGYDFTFILGGALLTLALPFVVTLLPAALPAIFWGWIIFFEGSHFWATLSRTYFDRKFSTEHRGVLVRSLVFFLIPALAVAHWKLTGSKLAIDLYGFAIFVWSLYHNTRQHYGFLSIYAKREDATAERKAKRTTLLYFAICVPQLYFLMFHKGPLALSFFPKPADLGSLAPILRAACWTLSAATGVALLAQLLRPGEGKRPMTVVYSTVCWVFYCTMFYAVAPREPFLVGAQNGAQLLMLLAVMNSLFHNIQYHAIVWIYARRRYAENVTPADARSGFRVGGADQRLSLQLRRSGDRDGMRVRDRVRAGRLAVDHRRVRALGDERGVVRALLRDRRPPLLPGPAHLASVAAGRPPLVPEARRGGSRRTGVTSGRGRAGDQTPRAPRLSGRPLDAHRAKKLTCRRAPPHRAPRCWRALDRCSAVRSPAKRSACCRSSSRWTGPAGTGTHRSGR